MNLMFKFPCIVSIIITDNQQDAMTLIYLFLISSTCLGDVFVHHKEHITVTTASGSSTQYATPASYNIGGQYQKL